MLAKCGTIESCDCLVTVYKHKGISIVIESDVFLQYGKQIKKVVTKTLNENNVKNVKVVVNDKGALDYTIKSRVFTALERGGLL